MPYAGVISCSLLARVFVSIVFPVSGRFQLTTSMSLRSGVWLGFVIGLGSELGLVLRYG